MATAGKTLKVERVRARVTITDLAARMALSRQTLWGIERAAVVDTARVVQYRVALESLRDATETTEGAA